MSVDADSSISIEYEELLAKHREENKKLRARIQALKKASQGDKKKKKEVAIEIAGLEQDLESRHKEELAQFQSLNSDKGADGGSRAEESSVSIARGTVDALGEGVAQMTVMNGEGEEDGQRKKSRAQKRKAKKAQQERERSQRIEDMEAAESSIVTPRMQEREKLSSILTPLRLAIRDITPDGHCLYAAVSDQLSIKLKIKVSVSELRSRCCEYIRTNSSEFLPYLTHPQTGDQFTQDQFYQYCQDIADTASWGGQLEIRALSYIFKTAIDVYQANVPVVCIGEEYAASETLNLSFDYQSRVAS